MKIRLLKADEVECRVGTINEKGLTILIYKDARVDMNLLDEAVGASNWQRKHYELKGHIYCSVGIKAVHVEGGGNSSDEWVWKDDVGTESQSEATKGESSDSFKRACFNWGIGRELYSAPFIWISNNNYTQTKNTKTGKPTTYDKFSVEKIQYDDAREIAGITIKNTKTGKRVFSWQKDDTKDDNNPTTSQSAPKQLTGMATDKQRQTIANHLKALGVAEEDQKGYLIEQYGVELPLSKQVASDLIDQMFAS